MTKVLPYVYMCKEKNGPLFYIGYRFANKVPSGDDFGIKYFTSNEYVQSNFDKFEHIVLAEFFTKEDAYRYESYLIKETKSEHQINHHKDLKKRGITYNTGVTVDNSPKVCALPTCNKVHTNWRMKCCCLTHQRTYSALRRHKSI